MLILLVFACILGGCGSTRDDVNTPILNTGYDVVDSTGTKLHFTKTPELPGGRYECIWVSLLISWVLGAVLTVIFYRIGKWKNKGLES